MFKRFLKRVFLLLFLVLVIWAGVSYWFSEPARLLPANTKLEFEVIAHRGGRGIAPENTMMAFEKSEELGVDVLEFDIHLSRDGQLVIIHDATLDRTTNGTGPVRDYTFDELQTFDAAHYFSPDPNYNNKRDSSIYQGLGNDMSLFPLRGTGVKIPALSDVFRRFPGKRMIIEIKPKNLNIIAPFCHMIEKFHKQDYLIIGSFHGNVLVRFRETCPEVATSAGPGEALRFVLAEKVGLSSLITPQYESLQVMPRLDLKLIGDKPTFYEVDSAFVEAANDKRLLVQVWTVNDVGQMKQLKEAGVNGIMTDYPDQLLELPAHYP